ncbi:hypothetical protein ES703_88337 [subsurface metagenome]
MPWRKSDFTGALNAYLYEFDRQPGEKSLALVWRTPDEYNVLDYWLLEKILGQMSQKELRVVLWLDREEAAKMISIMRRGN